MNQTHFNLLPGGKIRPATIAHNLEGYEAIVHDTIVSGEGMAESVTGRPLGQAGLSYGNIDRLPEDGRVNMMPSFFAGLCVLPAAFLREDPLPAPFLWRVGAFAIKGIRQQHSAISAGWRTLWKWVNRLTPWQ